MPEPRAQLVAKLLGGVIFEVETFLGEADVPAHFKEIGTVYLELSRRQQKRFIVDPLIVGSVNMPTMDVLETRAKNISAFVGQRNWSRTLRESHAFLNSLPGLPGSEPEQLPLPPDDD